MDCTKCSKYVICGLIAQMQQAATSYPGLRYTQENPTILHLVANNCTMYEERSCSG